jgi:thymidine phosphorylase
MFRVKRLRIDTLSEHVVFVHGAAVREGALGFNPLDRVRVVERGASGAPPREVIGVLNLCEEPLVAADEIGLSEVAFRDLGLPEGAAVDATISPAPASVDRVRSKIAGRRLSRGDFEAVLADVVARRYSKIELTMFVLACTLQRLDHGELVDLTRAMISTGSQLDFGPGPVADKHCIGGVPGNRTTMIVVPILAALGVRIPKTSSRAITSPAGTADTMGVLANVTLSPERLRRVVDEVGGCIAWGGALGLAPADDVLITVERPMEVDTETQMVASILSKKKTAGATHVLLDVPVGPTAKVRSDGEAAALAHLFTTVGREIGLRLEVVTTPARGPVGFGIGPRLEALDVLAVLERRPGAPPDLRDRAVDLAGRLLELVSAAPAGEGRAAAHAALERGDALRTFDRIVDAQGRRDLPREAAHRHVVTSPAAGRIAGVDCWEIARVAKRAGAPVNAAAGVRLLRTVGDAVEAGEPLFEIHAESSMQLGFARGHAEARPSLVRFER